jgi:asparagine synthase (glutamine-hydrolysing)
MCGLVGKVSWSNPVVPAHVAALRDRIAYRGPDDAGLWVDPEQRVVLGHRRLSIIDLSSAGHQPMLSSCGRYVVVFNGEIYNYLEVRSELQRLGVGFRGAGDTEVILEAYRRWGTDCLTRLNGMFALALWDRGSDQEPPRLFIARDRVGKKPFYFAHAGRTFSFASELKALDHAGNMDLRALNFYLALGYIPNNLCLRSGAQKLRPAEAGLFDPISGRLKLWSYWSPPANAANPASGIEDLANEAQALLTDAVRLRMRADVPIGVLLSGGTDSSLITAIAAGMSSGPIKTFTVSFPGTAYDEAGRAAVIARHFGTDHCVLPVGRPSLDVMQTLARDIDEPIGDSSFLPTYLVSRLTRQHVTVALGGDGGDELFAGYPHYADVPRDVMRYLPRGPLALASRLAAMLPAGIKGRNRLQSLRGGASQSVAWGSPYFDVDLRRRILSPDAVQALGSSIDAPERWRLDLLSRGADAVDRMTRADFLSVLPDDYLVKIDRASMLASLEMRAPLLDYKLVEFAFGRLPSIFKAHRGETRKIERVLARRLLPEAHDSERKQGFSIPLDGWLRESNGAIVEEVRGDLPGFINQAEMKGLMEGHRRGRANGSRLFSLVMLALANRNWAHA